MSITTRLLTEADVTGFRDLRLRSLKEHPSAFGSSYEEAERQTQEEWIQRLLLPHVACFGAFLGEKMVGINALARENYLKSLHRATIVAMYTLPEVRGQGAGKALMLAALNHAKTLEGLEDIILAVTVGNAAKHLYEKLGFQVYSRDPRLFKINDQYFDVEWMILPLKEYNLA